MDGVKLIECPRESWQALRAVPPALKAEYLRALVTAGFSSVDAMGYYNSTDLPTMNDTDAVLEQLEPPGFDPRHDDAVELLAMITSVAGAERAIATGAFKSLLFPYSISPTFLERNQRQAPQDALEELEQIGELAYKAGIEVVAHVGMAFGNPYGDAWDVDEVVSAVDLLVDNGVEQVTLVDTAGSAGADLLGGVLRLVLDVHADVEIGVALHTPPATLAEVAGAAWQAGCRRFDAVLGGGGSEPLAGEWLPGLVATEALLPVLREHGAELPELGSLDNLLRISQELRRRFAPQAN